jgi:hypothetical protein
MTRDERAAKRAERLKEDIATKSQELAKLAARQRAAAKQARVKRRLRWARMLEQLGLLNLDDAALQEVLTVAYHLVQGGHAHRATSPEVAVQEQAVLDADVLALDPTLTLPSCTPCAPSPDPGNTIAR